MMNIQANNLKKQFDLYASEYERKAVEVLQSGWYILGKEVLSFEKEFSDFIGTKYCLGVANGLDALQIAFHVLGIGSGDDVIVSANAYIACVMGITLNGANPIFVEPDIYENIDADQIEKAITEKTKAILAVHLFGQACDMTKIMNIADKYHLQVVEDCAQSHGNHWQGKMVGSFGKIGCFSFYPTKGCGGFGDGGAIVTDDADIAEKVRVFRNYGSPEKYVNQVVGMNSRLDELQAGLLRVKLNHIPDLNEERNVIANRYNKEISNPLIRKPLVRSGADSSWHQYVIHTPHRKQLISFLEQAGIGTIIHYPVPPYLSPAYAYLGYKKGDFPLTEKYASEILSLPIYNGMTQEEQSYVIDQINVFKVDDGFLS